MKLGEIGLSRRVCEYRSGMVFRVAGHDHYGKGITTLLSEYIVNVRALDAAEKGDPAQESVFEKKSLYGNNNYPDSNLHRWLNARTKAWYRPANEADNPPSAEHLRFGEVPYEEEEGFLCRFGDPFINALAETDIPVLVRTGKLKAELTSVKTAVFAPSRSEMNKGAELDIPDGRTLPIFYEHYEPFYKAIPTQEQLAQYGRSWNPEQPQRGVKFDAPQIYDPKYGWWYYMRTPNTQYAYLERVMSPYGAVSYTYANNDVVGIRPVINLYSDTQVYDIGETTPLYCIG